MELDTALAVAEQEAAGEQNMELAALSPSELLAAHTHLVTWCDTKVKAVRAELNEYRENLSIAKKNGWRTSGLTRAVATAEKRIAYYEKIKIALNEWFKEQLAIDGADGNNKSHNQGADNNEPDPPPRQR